MKAPIAFVTWSGLPELAQDDRLAARQLRERGFDVVAVAWDDASVDWAAFACVVLRSCWDYHLRPDAFDAWLDRLAREGVALWNPPELVRWNAHKRYLVELAGAGLHIVPTSVVPRGETELLAEVVARLDGGAGVVKPAVAASSYGARLISASDARTPALADLCQAHDLLVQPFIDAIGEAGEWSLVFVGGEFSHAIRKKPAPGDFRVQTELGGSAEAMTPPRTMIESAWKTLSALPHPWLYARVDGVPTGDGLLIMELELIEPSLFLDLVPDAADRFADAIQQTMRLRG